MDKIKVGFEVDDTWARGDFRDFITSVNNNDNYEVWIVSSCDSSAYIKTVGLQLELPDERVIVSNFTDDKVQTITDKALDIYFENLQKDVVRIDAETPCHAILVDSMPNKYQMRPKYQVEFERTIKELINEEKCAGGETE